MKSRFAKGIVLGAIVSGLTVASTAAFAGTGIGGVFNLGRTNTVNGATVLQGSTNGQQLRVVNSSNGARRRTASASTPSPPGRHWR